MKSTGTPTKKMEFGGLEDHQHSHQEDQDDAPTHSHTLDCR